MGGKQNTSIERLIMLGCNGRAGSKKGLTEKVNLNKIMLN